MAAAILAPQNKGEWDMDNMKRLLALCIALSLACALWVGSLADESVSDEGAMAEERPEGAMVCAVEPFAMTFSPFYCWNDSDRAVVDLVSLSLLAEDRCGAEILDGIKGETVAYGGVDYDYQGAGSVEIVENEDGTCDYNLTLRDDIVFSDGEPATIDDVIFGIYVECDPTYDGSGTLATLPIQGLAEYRGQMRSLGGVILADGEGEGYVANDLYTEDQYTAFWTYYNEEAGAAFAQEICDYCVLKGYNSADDSVADCARNWGYDLDSGATTRDFWKALKAAYDTVEMVEANESAGSTLLQLTIENLGGAFGNGVENEPSAPNISGVIRTGDYTATVRMTAYNAADIYGMDLWVAPMHYYGDAALYDYANNSFGFVKGSLSGVKAKTAMPLGAGAYSFESCVDGVATLNANPNYYKGAPRTPVLMMCAADADDYVDGIVDGRYDIAFLTSNDSTARVRQANADGMLAGEMLYGVLVDNPSFGYIGINADLVNVNGEPASAASKALRKGFMTVFAPYRESAVASYYGDRAAVIQYPISDTSWAVPRPTDVGYQVDDDADVAQVGATDEEEETIGFLIAENTVFDGAYREAYSLDADGKPIYEDGMSEEERYAAALQAAIGYFKAAGFTYDEAQGKFTDMTETYEILIPGAGERNHAAFAVADAASKALAGVGVTLKVTDASTHEWNDAVSGNTAMMWAGAWQASVDPDDMMTIYASENARGKGTNLNHYAVDDADLDALIRLGRASVSFGERKQIYRKAMEIIMDWGCELPMYQRKDCVAFSAERVDTDTLPGDMTPYWGWQEQVEAIALRN